MHPFRVIFCIAHTGYATGPRAVETLQAFLSLSSIKYAFFFSKYEKFHILLLSSAMALSLGELMIISTARSAGRASDTIPLMLFICFLPPFQFLWIDKKFAANTSQAGQHHQAVIGALGQAILFVLLLRETLTLGTQLLI